MEVCGHRLEDLFRELGRALRARPNSRKLYLAHLKSESPRDLYPLGPYAVRTDLWKQDRLTPRS